MGKERDFILDNIKGLLMLLVVFGHIIEPLVFEGNLILDNLYTAIYMFHMPVFIFISGYFSKKNKVSSVIELFCVYSFWQLIMYPLTMAVIHKKEFFEIYKGLAAPFKTYWYLLSLLAWKVITPYVSKIKFSFPIVLVLATLFGLSNSPVNLAHLSLGRTVTFYPFFLAGYYFKKEYIAIIRKSIKKHIGFITFIFLIVGGVWFLNSGLNDLIKETDINKILFGKHYYDEIYNNPINGVMYKTVLYCIQFLVILAIISFASAKNTILSKIGANTLFIYLSHILAIEVYYYFNQYSQSEINNTVYIVSINLILAFIFCYILSLKPIQKVTNKFVRFNVDKILVKK